MYTYVDIFVCMYVSACVYYEPVPKQGIRGRHPTGEGWAHGACAEPSVASANDSLNLLIPSILHTHHE